MKKYRDKLKQKYQFMSHFIEKCIPKFKKKNVYIVCIL